MDQPHKLRTQELKITDKLAKVQIMLTLFWRECVTVNAVPQINQCDLYCVLN